MLLQRGGPLTPLQPWRPGPCILLPSLAMPLSPCTISGCLAGLRGGPSRGARRSQAPGWQQSRSRLPSEVLLRACSVHSHWEASTSLWIGFQSDFQFLLKTGRNRTFPEAGVCLQRDPQSSLELPGALGAWAGGGEVGLQAVGISTLQR